LTRKESLKAPLRVGEGFGEGSDPSLIDQQLHAIRPYKRHINYQLLTINYQLLRTFRRLKVARTLIIRQIR
jgi:hypothetical protein